MRRVAVVLLVTVTVVCVALALRPLREGGGETEQASATSVWSARRLPGPLLDGIAQLRVRSEVAAALDGTTACVVVDAPAGRIVDVGAEPLVPASTIKILTALGAMAVLGEDHRFTTTVEAIGPVTGDTVTQLALVGGADPLLGTPEWIAAREADPVTAGTVTTSLASLADQIVASGIREVPGGIVGVAPWWPDEPSYLPSWPASYRADAIGPLSSLTVDGGFRAPGDPAPDPAAFAAGELARLLADRGVTVAPTTTAAVAPGGEVLARIDSAPLGEVIDELLAVSDNLTAEVLVREVARARGAGSTADGIAIIHEELVELGIPLEGLTQDDGSGLSRGSRVPCETLQIALRVSEAPELTAVAEGFAVAGERGTLATRLRGTPLEGHLRAKTGTLDGVTGLVGWLDLEAPLRFSMLAAGDFGLEGAFALRDRFAAALASYPDAPSPEALPAP